MEPLYKDIGQIYHSFFHGDVKDTKNRYKSYHIGKLSANDQLYAKDEREFKLVYSTLPEH